jgi:hypothetical protein
MENTFKQEITKTLAHFADGSPRDISADSPINIDRVKWLYEAGYLKGIDASTIHPGGEQYIDLVITLKGTEFLDQSKKEVMEGQNRESAYEKNYPMRSKVAVGVAIGVLVAFVVAIFGYISHGD